MHPYDTNTTKYVNPRNMAITWLHYSIEDETVRIKNSDHILECKFCELEGTLKALGMYRERARSERHSLAGPQITVDTM